MRSGDPGIRTEELSELIALIYSTIDEPLLWAEVLTRMGRAIRAENALLFVSGDGQSAAHRCRNTSETELLQPFLEHYAGVNVLAAPCDRMFREGETRYSHWAVPDVQFERSEFCQDFFRRLGLFYSVGIKGRLQSGAEVYLSLQRARQQEGFEESEGRLLPMLLPHLTRALAVQQRVMQAGDRAATADEALRAMDGAVVGLDALGRVRYCSAGAESVLRKGEVLQAHGGRLQATEPTSDAELKRCVREGLRGRWTVNEGGGPMTAATLRDASGEVRLRVAAVPRTSTAVSKGVGPSERGVALLLYLNEPGKPLQSREGVLRVMFGATPTEQRVAEGLLAGQEVAEIAAGLRMSKDATRFHVKRLLTKTGTRRQAELVRLLTQMPGTPSA